MELQHWKSEKYTVSLNGKQYKYQRSGSEEKLETLSAIANSITDDSVAVSVNQDEKCLLIANKALHQNGELDVSGNLAVEEVTSVLNFWTTGYGKVMIPYGIITEIVDNIVGFDSVTNAIEPTYGRAEETDIELRQSYLVKSALRSNTMIDSIVSELVCNVDGIESAAGYETAQILLTRMVAPRIALKLWLKAVTNLGLQKLFFAEKPEASRPTAVMRWRYRAAMGMLFLFVSTDRSICMPGSTLQCMVMQQKYHPIIRILLKIRFCLMERSSKQVCRCMYSDLRKEFTIRLLALRMLTSAWPILPAARMRRKRAPIKITIFW